MWRLAQLLYLMLPVYAANMAAPFTRFWPGRVWPISERWLGSHKTWLGVVFACIAATGVAFVQSRLDWPGDLLADDARWFVVGPACGLAAMAGDALKSLVKRRVGIAPGERWVPADQWDFTIAGLWVLSLWADLGWRDVAWVLGLTLMGAIVVNRIAFRLGIKRTPW